MAATVETMIRNTVTKGILKLAAFNRNRLPSSDQPHTFLTGIHAPMSSELTITDLQVTGSIPPELNGRYLRIGPNPITPPDPRTYHWFMGDGMVHGIKLKSGSAQWYRNRWIRSNKVSAALGEAPAPGQRHAGNDLVNTNILGHAGKTWALVEASSYPVELNEDLDTVAHNAFEGTLKGSFTAHPHLDPKTGEMHAICYYGPHTNQVRHVVVGKDGKVRREEAIEVKNGPSIHDCAITQKYVLIFDLPVTFSMKTLIAGHGFPYRWNDKHQARVGLLPREGAGSETIWCDVEPCYIFHPCNAFDNADGTVTVDVCAYKTMFNDQYSGPDTTDTKFERWIVNPQAHQVTRSVIDDSPQEFPRPNEKQLGQPYRYAYAMALPEKGLSAVFLDQTRLYKHDLVNKTRQVHDFGSQRNPGEFVFIPGLGATAEDDGWLMGLVVNMGNETTDLVILKANDFEGSPQAVISIPHRVPSGFHGNWLAASAEGK